MDVPERFRNIIVCAKRRTAGPGLLIHNLDPSNGNVVAAIVASQAVIVHSAWETAVRVVYHFGMVRRDNFIWSPIYGEEEKL